VSYSIVGSGAIGSAVAGHFARTNTDVTVVNSRAETAELDSALQADVVVLAVPFDAVRGIVERVDDWQGRIIVDATNAIDPTDFSPADLGGRASSALVAEWATNARVVKAFNHTWAKVLARDPGDSDAGRRVLFLSGDHDDAVGEIQNLLDNWGFAVINLGRVAEGGLLAQFGGPLTTLSLVSQPIGGATPPEMDVLA
jgi:8-hydroxy-5-deazaflavin:NADPH oxidoreductase